MNVKKYSILSIFAFLFIFRLSAQDKDELKRLGWKAFQDGNYYAATDYLDAAIDDEAADSLLFLLGRAYDKVHNHHAALQHYQQLINREKHTYPEALFYIAMMHKSLGNYQKAADYILQYSLEEDDKISPERIDQELRACELAPKIMQDSLPVRVEQPGEKINSPYTDFGAVQLGSQKLYFSSLRPKGESGSSGLIPRDFQTDIYHTSISPAGYQKAKIWKSAVNHKRKHSANIAFSSGGDTLYFTRCRRVEGEMICRIFMSNKEGNQWSEPEKLPAFINTDKATTTHPFPAKTTGQKVLYFASDRDGGFGNMDIWYSVIQEEGFARPVNLGSTINTPGDEITPFYLSADTMLYFSSDWHAGLGGYDIFRSSGGFASWTKPENLGYPLNTSSNDLYFTLNDNQYSGYITSNRPGSFFITSQKCCNDIFYFEFEEQKDSIPADTVTQPDTIDVAIQKARDLLPITLFFDNDVPSPSAKEDTTNKQIDQLLEEYLSRKPVYLDQYVRDETDKKRMQAFFKDIREAQFLLDSLVDYLHTSLSGGVDIHLVLKGYASPLTTEEYNLKLSQRRIVALTNYLYHAKDQLLKPYLSHSDTLRAHLHIYPEAFGEEVSEGKISDNPADKRNSIYSLAAARARKIVITELRSESRDTNIRTGNQANISLSPDSLFADTMKAGENKMIRMKIRNNSRFPVTIDSVEANELLFSFHFPSYQIGAGTTKNIYIQHVAPEKKGAWKSRIKIHIKGMPAPLVIPVSGFVK